MSYLGFRCSICVKYTNSVCRVLVEILKNLLAYVMKYQLQQSASLLLMVVQKSVENMNKGVDYMLMAAEAGDRSAMLYMAKAYETGVGLGENR